MDDLSALRAELVKLIIHQETIFSNWVRFVITVQGGLIAGLAFVLSKVPDYRVVLGFIIAFFGFLTALLFAIILCRHAQWSVWYVRRGSSLATTPEIFPTPKGKIRNPGLVDRLVVQFLSKFLPKDEIGELPLGLIALRVAGFLLLVAITWIVTFIIVTVL
jgi:hypothetical protein